MASTLPVLRLGTRGSLLARTQSQGVADALMARHPGLRVELVIVRTSGDQIADRPLHEAGGKGLFTKELEQALLAGEIDFAVHSFKDVPVTMPLVDRSELTIAAVPSREDARDALVSLKARALGDLPQEGRVGTGSLRRGCQILAQRLDLNMEAVRGNIDTRLAKLREGRFDAVILAMAGLRRTGLFDPSIMTPISVDEMLPAAGQGALALECRRADEAARRLLGELDDPMTHLCVRMEREVVLALDGDCHSPIAALATVEGNRLTLRAAVGAREGRPPVVWAQATAAMDQPHAALAAVLGELDEQNARGLLA